MEFRALATQELSALAARLADAAQKETEAATARLTASFEVTIERLRTDHAQVVSENERLTAENAALTWEKDKLLEQSKHNQRQALITALATVCDNIALGVSVEEIARAAADGLVGEFSRIAAFTIHDNRIELRHSSGFDHHPGAVSLATDAGQSFLAQLLRHDQLHRWHPDALMRGAPFGGAPSSIVTAPLQVRGEMVALLYADDAGQETAADRMEESIAIAAILRRHAMLALERLAIELKATAELRAYAKMLLDEVEYVYDADLAAKTDAAARRERIKENIRCARQIYAQRVAVEGPTAAVLLDELIATTLAERADSPFAEDLAAATHAEPAAKRAVTT